METNFIDESNPAEVELLDEFKPSVQLDELVPAEKLDGSEPVPKRPKDSEYYDTFKMHN